MNKIWEITQEEKSLPTLHHPVLIEGLPGIGNVGKIAADFLVEELKAKKLYSFFSYQFPHSVFVNEKNLVDLPKITFYYKIIKGREFIFLTGDVQPVDEYGCYQFCHEVLELFSKFKGKTMVTLGGIGLSKIPEKPKLYVTGSSMKALKNFDEKIVLFMKNPNHPSLKTHKLRGELQECLAFRLKDGYRVLFEFSGSHTVDLLDVGSHDIYKQFQR